MSHFKRLTEEQLSNRAKVLFFDKMKNLKKIYMNEYGQASYRKEDLEEINKHTEVKLFEITREGIKDWKPTETLNDFSKEEDIEKEFGSWKKPSKKPSKKAETKKEDKKEDDKKDDKKEAKK